MPPPELTLEIAGPCDGAVVDGVLFASEIEGLKDQGKPAGAGSQDQGTGKDKDKPDTPSSPRLGASDDKGKPATPGF